MLLRYSVDTLLARVSVTAVPRELAILPEMMLEPSLVVMVSLAVWAAAASFSDTDATFAEKSDGIVKTAWMSPFSSLVCASSALMVDQSKFCLLSLLSSSSVRS